MTQRVGDEGLCVFLLHVLERVMLIPRAVGNVTWHRSYCQGPMGLHQDFDKIHNASALAGLVLEGVSLTQTKLSPSFGFSSASFLCCGSLLGITHDPTVITSNCPTAGEGHPLACDEQSVTSGQGEVSGAIPCQSSQPSDGDALWE